jgi:hypothetical protein
MVGIPNDPEKIRAAVSALRAVWVETAALLESRVRERCPHRRADDRCVYPAGCVNQRKDRGRGAVRCGGDGMLRREAP